MTQILLATRIFYTGELCVFLSFESFKSSPCLIVLFFGDFELTFCNVRLGIHFVYFPIYSCLILSVILLRYFIWFFGKLDLLVEKRELKISLIGDISDILDGTFDSDDKVPIYRKQRIFYIWLEFCMQYVNCVFLHRSDYILIFYFSKYLNVYPLQWFLLPAITDWALP